MDRDDLDRILAGESRIEPSPGFVPSVMRAVRRAATEPPPLTFPWLRALPGLLAALVALAFGIYAAATETGDTGGHSFLSDATQAALAAVGASLHETGIGWIVLALAMTVLAGQFGVLLSRRSARLSN